MPYTRGAELSRTLKQVEDEVRSLVAQGVVEINLLGQNVNAWHGEDGLGNDMTFSGLIKRLAKIDGLERIRFTTSHPKNTGEDLIDLFGTEKKLMPYFHLPVQAGSDRVLNAMNRMHTAESYLNIIELVRMARPDIAISGDFIVGFPGESEEDFVQTLAVAEEVGYASAYSFAFSARPGTPAANMPGQIESEVKKERLARLQALLDRQQAAFNKKFAGKTVPVLVEEEGGKPGQLRGRSAHNIVVNLEGHARLKGQIVPAEITHAGAKSLRARVIAAV